MKNPWQHKVTLTRNGQDFTVNNPTPYYVIFSNASTQKKWQSGSRFLADGDVAENLCTAECEDGQRAGTDLCQRLWRSDAALLHYATVTVARSMKSRAAKAEAGRASMKGILFCSWAATGLLMLAVMGHQRLWQLLASNISTV